MQLYACHLLLQNSEVHKIDSESIIGSPTPTDDRFCFQNRFLTLVTTKFLSFFALILPSVRRFFPVGGKNHWKYRKKPSWKKIGFGQVAEKIPWLTALYRASGDVVATFCQPKSQIAAFTILKLPNCLAPCRTHSITEKCLCKISLEKICPNFPRKRAEKTPFGWDKGGKNSIWFGKRRKKTGKNPRFWTAKRREKTEKIGFGQVFSAILEKIPFFRPKREHWYSHFRTTWSFKSGWFEQKKRHSRENLISDFVKINFEGPIESQFYDPPILYTWNFVIPAIKGWQNLVIPPLSC